MIGAYCTACSSPSSATHPTVTKEQEDRSGPRGLLFAGLAVVMAAILAITASAYAMHQARLKAKQLVRDAESVPVTVEPVALSSPVAGTEQSDATTAAFPAWQSSSASPNPAPPRSGMLVVTAIDDPQGDYESMKQIRSIDAKGITLAYHGAKPTEKGQDITDLERLVLAQDLDKAHDYAQLFSRNQPQSIPGTTAITVSREVFTDLSQNRSSAFTFQPEGIRGAISNMVNVLSGFGVSSEHLGGDAELNKVSKVQCTLHREGSALVAFPVLLDDQPTTLPALRAGCSTDDGPAEFYILNQPNYPLMLAWKFGAGSQLQVTKISYPPTAKAADDLPSSHIEQQLKENKKVEIYGIYFDFGSDHLKPESEPVLREIGAVLAAHPDWKLKVSGHTDNIGGDDYNLDLSTRRSAAVKAELVSKYHVPAAALDTSGFGAAQPIDTNATLAGRARNRRVELVRE